jgi:uncharacterized protein
MRVREEASTGECIEAVAASMRPYPRLAVAVSGGIDSLTLAAIAGRHHAEVEMFHAISPAVPPEATVRVRELSAREGWTLREIDAGEFGKDAYMSNPVNRCYFCKQSLYASIGLIADATSAQIVSGTNADDLGEYRPGLEAAREHGVRHPFAELGIRKREIRACARALGLGEIAELPSSPCLSSRIESGIPISAPVLASVHRAEQRVRAMLPLAASVRCRVRGSGIVVEIDDASLASLDALTRERVLTGVAAVMRETHANTPVSLAPYRVGSAFLVASLERAHA